MDEIDWFQVKFRMPHGTADIPEITVDTLGSVSNDEAMLESAMSEVLWLGNKRASRWYYWRALTTFPAVTPFTAIPEHYRSSW